MSHIVLLGDSVFDNASYVPGGPSVLQHLGRLLPAGWRVTLLAVDGDVTADVARQLAGLPDDASHLVVSVGGNDALGHSGVLQEAARSALEVLDRLADFQAEFRDDYRRMLRRVRALGKPTAVCTIYDAVPGLERAAVTALAVFNDVILREAFAAGLPVLDLRLLCNEASDYSSVSPIEPSAAGGGKIARAVVRAVTEHDFSAGRSTIIA
jgi:hypothetical protein